MIRLYKDADILHCEPIDKSANEVISIYKNSFDNVSACRYEVPDYWTIGEVYERLIEDICSDNEDANYIIETLITVYSSWIDGAISIQIFSISHENTFLSLGKQLNLFVIAANHFSFLIIFSLLIFFPLTKDYNRLKIFHQ